MVLLNLEQVRSENLVMSWIANGSNLRCLRTLFKFFWKTLNLSSCSSWFAYDFPYFLNSKKWCSAPSRGSSFRVLQTLVSSTTCHINVLLLEFSCNDVDMEMRRRGEIRKRENQLFIFFGYVSLCAVSLFIFFGSWRKAGWGRLGMAEGKKG